MGFFPQQINSFLWFALQFNSAIDIIYLEMASDPQIKTAPYFRM